MTRKNLLSRVNDWLWQTTNKNEVMKDLADTKWDWLRTPRGLDTVITIAFFHTLRCPGDRVVRG